MPARSLATLAEVCSLELQAVVMKLSDKKRRVHGPCYLCGATKSPYFRKSELGTACNACGIAVARGSLISCWTCGKRCLRNFMFLHCRTCKAYAHKECGLICDH
jgi:hypothetical protein